VVNGGWQGYNTICHDSMIRHIYGLDIRAALVIASGNNQSSTGLDICAPLLPSVAELRTCPAGALGCLELNLGVCCDSYMTMA
jgi:hypothetical protein